MFISTSRIVYFMLSYATVQFGVSTFFFLRLQSVNCVQHYIVDFEIHLFTPRITEGLICNHYRRFIKIIQSLFERVQIHKNAGKPKNLWDLNNFSEEQQVV